MPVTSQALTACFHGVLVGSVCSPWKDQAQQQQAQQPGPQSRHASYFSEDALGMGSHRESATWGLRCGRKLYLSTRCCVHQAGTL